MNIVFLTTAHWSGGLDWKILMHLWFQIWYRNSVYTATCPLAIKDLFLAILAIRKISSAKLDPYKSDLKWCMTLALACWVNGHCKNKCSWVSSPELHKQHCRLTRTPHFNNLSTVGNFLWASLHIKKTLRRVAWFFLTREHHWTLLGSWIKWM